MLFLVQCEDTPFPEDRLWEWLFNWSKANVKDPKKDEKMIAKKMSKFIPFIHFGAMGSHFFNIRIIPFCEKHKLISKEVLSSIHLATEIHTLQRLQPTPTLFSNSYKRKMKKKKIKQRKIHFFLVFRVHRNGSVQFWLPYIIAFKEPIEYSRE